MADQKLIIPIEKIKSDFHVFLNPEHKRRIIFSGPFDYNNVISSISLLPIKLFQHKSFVICYPISIV